METISTSPKTGWRPTGSLTSHSRLRTALRRDQVRPPTTSGCGLDFRKLIEISISSIAPAVELILLRYPSRLSSPGISYRSFDSTKRQECPAAPPEWARETNSICIVKGIGRHQN